MTTLDIISTQVKEVRANHPKTLSFLRNNQTNNATIPSVREKTKLKNVEHVVHTKTSDRVALPRLNDPIKPYPDLMTELRHLLL